MSNPNGWNHINDKITDDSKEKARLIRFDELFPEETLELIEAWTRDNYSQREIAEKLGIAFTTFRSYVKDQSKLQEALKKGKELIDYRVENALLKVALGYHAKESKIITEMKNGVVVGTTRVVSTRDVAPSVPAIAMWLHNRCPDKWKKNRDAFACVMDDDSTVQISVVRANSQVRDDHDTMNESVTISKHVEGNIEHGIVDRKNSKRKK